ncbi:uncharacterized protein EI97DRAFT_435402 [Westerdykella ornata]|uniref:Uncharacterized protein n=1 Tax=Westerdykella ornata TaxID=318751 RepID=A0A6A6JC63_WESOR|nr:uncharacterized protein EI97DRAFT_435402 [Westerdykella ornata]KAF2274022.1 hypothetical protein EI97DRAFT_435402 [Westerdykella ornata]
MFNLIKAADISRATRRYITNNWSGVNYQLQKHGNINPLLTAKLQQAEELKKTTLEWTDIVNGIFLDYYAPGVTTHVRRFPLIVDVDHDVAVIPGDGEMTQFFTHTTDIGKYIAALLSLEKWECKYYIKGDALTWNRLLALAERAKGVKFDVTYDSAEKIEKGEVTLVRAHVEILSKVGMDEAMLKKFMETVFKALIEGRGDFGPGSYLNEIFPEIVPLKTEEALQQSFSK